MSVREKSSPLNSSGSERVAASAYARQSPGFSPAGWLPLPKRRQARRPSRICSRSNGTARISRSRRISSAASDAHQRDDCVGAPRVQNRKGGDAWRDLHDACNHLRGFGAAIPLSPAPVEKRVFDGVRQVNMVGQAVTAQHMRPQPAGSTLRFVKNEKEHSHAEGANA